MLQALSPHSPFSEGFLTDLTHPSGLTREGRGACRSSLSYWRGGRIKHASPGGVDRSVMLRVSWPFFNYYLFCVCMPVVAYTGHSIPVDVRGQPCGVSFLLPPCQSQGPNSRSNISHFHGPLDASFVTPNPCAFQPSLTRAPHCSTACSCPARPGDGCQPLP